MSNYDDWEENRLQQVDLVIAVSSQKLQKKGYGEDQIVAIDFEGSEVVFYMTDGEVVRIKNTPFLMGQIPDPTLAN